jgi:hypothetical protein
LQWENLTTRRIIGSRRQLDGCIGLGLLQGFGQGFKGSRLVTRRAIVSGSGINVKSLSHNVIYLSKQ